MTTGLAEIKSLPRIPYAVVVLQEQATDGSLVYRAEIPELPGCMSHGETEKEALQNLVEAMELYLETLAQRGQTVPRPRTLPLTSGTATAGAVRVLPAGAATVNFRLTGVRQESTP